MLGWIPDRPPSDEPYFGVDRDLQPLRLKPRVRVERLSWIVGGLYAFRTRAEARRANREIAFSVPVRKKASWSVGGVVFPTRRETRRYCRQVNGNR